MTDKGDNLVKIVQIANQQQDVKQILLIILKRAEYLHVLMLL